MLMGCVGQVKVLLGSAERAKVLQAFVLEKAVDVVAVQQGRFQAELG